VRVRSANTALDERLDAELSTLGFAVKGVDGGDPGLDLGTIARSNGAVAAIRVDPGDAVELWVAANRPGEPPIREVFPVDARRGWSQAAVQALEALRAHLLKVREEPPPAPPAKALEVGPPPPLPAPTLPARPWLWLHLAGGADASPGGLSPAAAVLLEARLEPRPWLSIAVFGAVAPLAARLDAPEGGALVRHAIAGAAADVQKHVSGATVSLGGGGAFVLMSVQGTDPAAGYGAQTASSVTVGPLLRSSASLEVAPALRVRVELAAGVTLPRSTISFAGREDATWGRPFGLLTLGAEWGALR